MALASMTGFARTQGTAGAWGWAWELKSVNGKGLDVRLRLPGGWEALEPVLKPIAARALSRGNVSANLSMTRAEAAVSVRVNEDVLRTIATSLRRVAADLDAPPIRVEGLLGIKGVMEVAEAEESPQERRVAEAAVIAGFEQALGELAAMRAQEGAALGLVLNERLDGIAALTAQAEANPARQPEAIRARLAEQIRALMDTGANFDPDRLHQEALMLATKVDVREELDRLVAHVAAARAMLAEGGAVGRKLDFLAQEFNRETNTLCSKANDVSLTAIGLELKGLVEQFREQVQNIE
ncbi:YicC/YloC family endoribonuclease [Ancylobacter mangrovi]|uniref:YicC family protein n=1 Tax=Ancylobacter mangrovi TaxID=2972472 RepID=A0A9X2PA49_9HYPH|nr:YicC/YloC family endoribonuclease [Ancylobacter mangrovi]MCS0493624.1 YicC family protein [Ancylobacter mangrovi]MCS0501758.1 YicC family protein [Ancylobacter mangrovi]